MATRQYDLHLLPRAKLIGTYSGVPDRLTRDRFDSVDWWEGHQPPPDYSQTLTGLLPRYTTWSERLVGWGEEDGNRLDVWLTGAGEVGDVFVRIDAREVDEHFLRSVVHFAEKCNGVFLLMEDMSLVEPELLTLLDAVRRSQARRFVEDPKGFLKGLKR